VRKLCGVEIFGRDLYFGKMGKICGCGERGIKEKEKWKEIHKEDIYSNLEIENIENMDS